VPAAAPEPSPAPAPAALPAPSAPAPVEVRTSEPATAAPVTKPEDSLAAGASLGSRVRGALDDGLHWAWGLLLLPLLAWLWAWQRHRSLYDEAGLPRGPKLR